MSSEKSARVLLTPYQVQRLLGVSYDTLKKWRAKNIGPRYLTLPGGNVRYPEDLLRQYQDNQLESQRQIIATRTRRIWA